MPENAQRKSAATLQPENGAAIKALAALKRPAPLLSMASDPQVSPSSKRLLLLEQTEAFLHEQIPLTRAMGVRVESFAERELVLSAPLALNHNHLGSAFGGSLSALATLAGYALLWLELQDRAAHVVIAGSTLKFRRPVRGELRACCRQPPPDVLSAFREEFSAKGKAGLTLPVEIRDENGALAVEFEGRFVAVKEQRPR